jgi:hypothetical protein
LASLIPTKFFIKLVKLDGNPVLGEFGQNIWPNNRRTGQTNREPGAKTTPKPAKSAGASLCVAPLRASASRTGAVPTNVFKDVLSYFNKKYSTNN